MKIRNNKFVGECIPVACLLAKNVHQQASPELADHYNIERFNKMRGFTMVELITIMVIVGILAAVAVPRFFDKSTFDSRGFYDQVISTLRYAQKSAVAQHRFVCVVITGGDTITLTQGTTNACGGNLTSPTGQTPYLLRAPTGVTVSNASFNFDALGKPSVAINQSITVSGYAAAITVEAETGYVH